MERSFDQTAEGWDAASGQYACLFAPHTAQYADDVLRFYGPGAGDTILELAAGSGALTARALQEPPVLGTVEGIEAELAAAGFTQIEVRQVTHAFEVASKEVYVRDFPQANPMGIMMQKMMPPAAREALAQQIGAELAAECADGPVRLAGVATIACARR